jgi:methionyl-tRNA formyltransferase
MKVAFAGTPEFAAAALEAILAAGFDVPLVLTQPDRPAGRGMQLQPSPVKQVALAAGIPVHQPEKLRTPSSRRRWPRVQADVLVVAAYGIILPQAVLDLPRLAASTSTPRCCRAGAAPRPSTARSRPATRRPASPSCRWTPASTPGRCCCPAPKPIHADDTTGSLHDRLAQLGAR